MQKHWLILSGIILSTTILGFGNAAYRQSVTNLSPSLNSAQNQQINTNQESHNNQQAIEDKSSDNEKSFKKIGNDLEKIATSYNQEITNNTQSTITSSPVATQTPTINPSPTQTSVPNSTTTPQPSTSSSSSTPTPVSTPTPPAQTQSQNTLVEQKTINLNIEGVGDYKVAWQDNDNAWTIMLRTAAKYNFAMTYKEYPFGIYIMMIGDKKSEGTYYWALYYNGSYSILGASDLKPQPNDTISWKYESWL